MSASKLLQLLEQSGMLDKPLIQELRKQIAESKYKVSAESIAKVLVDKGHLTKFQATKLVGQATEDEDQPPAPVKPAASPPPKRVPEKTRAEERSRVEEKSQPEEDDLGLAPDDAAELGIQPASGSKPAATKPSAATPGEEDVVLLEDAGGAAEPDEGLTPVVDAGAALMPVGPVVPVLTPAPSPAVPELEPVGPSLDSPLGMDPFAQTSSMLTPPILPPAPRRHAPRWDTMLIWGGSLALALLVLFGSVLWYSLSKTPPLEMFEAAMKDYRAESYSQAVAKFQNFLKQYPKDEKASEARVRVALAQMRLAAGSPESGLKTAQELIPTIALEPSFQVAREEFSGILPPIPEGFVRQAKTTDDMTKAAALLAKADEGMKLVLDPANIPTSIRTRIDTTIQRIQEDMALVQRSIDQDKELAAALVEIETATAANNTVKAYQVYRELVRKYPGLDANPRLNSAVVGIGQRERGLVKVSTQAVEPKAPADESVAVSRLVLARRNAAGESGVKDQVAAVLAGGSAYGIDVGNGHVLWRRFVGQGTRFHPQRLSDQPGSDVLCSSAERQEIQRCRARDGAIVWQLRVGEGFSNPVIAGRTIYVATDSGRLWEVDSQTGVSKRQCVIPQKLVAGPAVAPNRPRAFQPGEHSNLYVISTDNLECKDVFYVGHKAGAISLPPLVLLNCVFVVENAGADYCLLHTLSIRSEADGPALKTAQPPIRLSGNVRVPLTPYGRRLLVTTDRGEIRVFDVDVANATEPVKDAAKLPPMHNEPVIGYPLTDASSLWIADNRLSSYRVQVTTKEINRNPAIADVGDVFVAPLQLFQNVLVHVRRVKDSAGTTVAGVPIDNPRKPLWETNLGVPIGHVHVESPGGEVTAVTAGAAVYRIPSAKLGDACLDEPNQSLQGVANQLFTESLDCGDGTVALFNPADARRFVHFVPAADGGRVSLIEAKNFDGQTTCVPIAFQKAILLLADKGNVRLIKPSSGEDQAMPFQPKLEPGELLHWRRPVATGAEGREFVAADDRRFLYRVGLKEQPQAILAQLGDERLEMAVTTDLAAVGATVYAAAWTENSDVLLAVKQSDLKVTQQWDLQGRVSWGPVRVGDVVMLAVDGKTIRCFDANNKPRWETPSPANGAPAGLPLQVGGNYVFASVDGMVWKVQGQTGKAGGKLDVREPLSRGPLALGDKLLLCGSEGSLLVAPLPSEP